MLQNLLLIGKGISGFQGLPRAPQPRAHARRVCRGRAPKTIENDQVKRDVRVL
jgi:hypothetical protein